MARPRTGNPAPSTLRWRRWRDGQWAEKLDRHSEAVLDELARIALGGEREADRISAGKIILKAAGKLEAPPQEDSKDRFRELIAALQNPGGKPPGGDGGNGVQYQTPIAPPESAPPVADSA